MVKSFHVERLFSDRKLSPFLNFEFEEDKTILQLVHKPSFSEMINQNCPFFYVLLERFKIKNASQLDAGKMLPIELLNTAIQPLVKKGSISGLWSSPLVLDWMIFFQKIIECKTLRKVMCKCFLNYQCLFLFVKISRNMLSDPKP